MDTLLGTAHGGRGGDGAGGVTDFGAEEMRHAETFQGAWVNEAVIVTESQRLAQRLQELQARPRAEAK